MTNHDQTLQTSLNDVKEFNVVKFINSLINKVLYSSSFNQFITIILK